MVATGVDSREFVGTNRLTSLASKPRAVEGEAVQWAEHSYGNLFGTEKVARESLHVAARHSFDRSQDFIEGIKTAEIEFLTREIRHPRRGRLQRKHQRALQVILRACELFFTDGRFLHR